MLACGAASGALGPPLVLGELTFGEGADGLGAVSCSWGWE